jgi:hypothetical protein
MAPAVGRDKTQAKWDIAVIESQPQYDSGIYVEKILLKLSAHHTY